MNAIFDEVHIFKTDRDDLLSAVRNLAKWGCCPRCVLRFVGVNEADFYRRYDLARLTAWVELCCSSNFPRTSTCEMEIKPDTTAAVNGAPNTAGDSLCDAKVDDSLPIESPSLTECAATVVSTPAADKQGLCISCLGILEDKYCCLQFAKRVCDAVQKQNFEFSSFFCSISLPICLLLREHAVWVALSDLLPAAFIESIRDCTATVKDVWKWINGPSLVVELGMPFDQKSTFEIVLTFEYSKTDEECKFLNNLFPDIFRRRKNNRFGWEVFTRTNVARAIDNTTSSTFCRHFSCPPKPPQTTISTAPVTCQQAAIYIAGRYNKYSRQLSQTPWLVDGKRKSDSSVEELICQPLNKYVLAAEWRFSASGREDVDVRMLGNGRPFVVELTNPHRVTFTAEQLKEIQNSINDGATEIEVRDLQLVHKDETSVLKDGEENKTKRYVALCWSHDRVSDDQLAGLSAVANLVLQQRTPIRVLHRRPLATRERTVYSLSAERVGGQDSHHFAVRLLTQAGTYVKEFVHGDLGRTKPSLGDLLLTECDILALDVIAVELDWPKSLGQPNP